MISDLRGELVGRTLVITEKPETAKRIAFALDREKNPRKMLESGVPYYVAQQNEEIVVVPALGHLYTVGAEKDGRSCCPVLKFKWVPRYLAEKRAKRTRPWLMTFAKLARNANRFVDACDYDIEGSIIGYNILKYACKGKEKTAERMKYSTLTDDELQNAYRNPVQHLDFALIEAGLARHEIDWLYGINLSRTLAAAMRNCSGKYKTLSIGRVQGPTLKFLATREKAIRNFIPVCYWQINATIQIDSQFLEAEYEKTRINNESEALTIKEACDAKNGVIRKIEKRLIQRKPPVPFDLGTLQAEAYRLFKYTPRTTSEIAQRLYLAALISYPRTSGQKLPLTIDYRKVLENLQSVADYRQLIADLLTKPRLIPQEGKRQDLAHPAIYPTGRIPESLGRYESNLWDLIVRRFMAVFAEPVLKQLTKVTIDIGGYCFYLTAEQTVKDGWIRCYKPYVVPKHTCLPQMKETQSVTVEKIDVRVKMTESPPRHDPRSLLRKMENADIGTKGTRAEIIETLYDREYVKGEKMVLTDLGLELVDVLEENCPSIISPELTREIENQMNSIRVNGEKRDRMISENVDRVKTIVQEFKVRENEIGERLTQAARRTTAEEKTIGTCPTCEKGALLIIHSRTTGKRFIGCTNYFKGICRTSFPLPQNGIITRSGKTCKRCRWPTLKVQTRPKHFWTLCFNPECPRKRNKSGMRREIHDRLSLAGRI